MCVCPCMSIYIVHIYIIHTCTHTRTHTHTHTHTHEGGKANTECAFNFSRALEALLYTETHTHMHIPTYLHIPTCAHTQIEEGEVDTERGRQFSTCFRKQYKREKDEAMEQARREKREAKLSGL